jgi:putative ABC transport system permease protein
VIRFALGNLLTRRLRTVLALVGLAVAIAGLVGLISFSIGLRSEMSATADDVGGIMVLEASNVSPAFSRLDPEVVARVVAVEGVGAHVAEVFAPVLEMDGAPTFGQGSMMQGIPVTVGLDPAQSRELRGGGYFARHLAEGEVLPDLPSGAVLIGRQVADRYDKELGSTLTISQEEFHVVGIYEASSPLLAQMIVMHIDRARELLDLQEDAVSVLYVEATEASETGALAERIRTTVDEVDARSMEEWADVYGDLSRTVDLFLGVITGFAVVVGAIGIANTMLMSVVERTSEIGVLRATGWSRGQVLRLIIVESAVLGTLGGVLGLGLGVAAGNFIQRFVQVSPVFSLELCLLALTLAAVTGTFGGLYPAWRASRLDVVSALRAREG